MKNLLLFVGIALCVDVAMNTAVWVRLEHLKHQPPAKADCEQEHREHMKMMSAPRCRP